VPQGVEGSIPSSGTTNTSQSISQYFSLVAGISAVLYFRE